MTTLAIATAIFFGSLVAGFLFAFAVVVMPGLRALDDADYLRAFRLIDGVIQNNQPLFILVWVGSLLAMIVAMILGGLEFGGVHRALLLATGALYLGGVGVLTAVVHLPLNANVQRLRIDEVGPQALREARAAFEPRWNRWNRVRTVIAAITVGLMLVVLTGFQT